MNRIRGEAVLDAGDKRYVLCLTLGALAEIQDGLGLSDLSQIAPRMAHLRAADIALVTCALIRGGGADVSPSEVLHFSCPLTDLMTAISDAFAAALPEETQEVPDNGPFVGRP